MKPAALADAAEWRKKSAPIAAALIAPIAAQPRRPHRVIIIPDDLLWKVPFEALPVRDGTARGERPRDATRRSLATLGRAASAADAAAAAAPNASTVRDCRRAGDSRPRSGRRSRSRQPAWKEPDAEVVPRRGRRRSPASTAIAATVTRGPDATEAAMRTAFATADVAPCRRALPGERRDAAPVVPRRRPCCRATSPTTDPQTRRTLRHDGRWEFAGLVSGKGAHARARGSRCDRRSAAAGAARRHGRARLGRCRGRRASVVVGRWPADGFTPNALLGAFHREMAKGMSIGDAWRPPSRPQRAAGDAPAAWSGARLIGAVR